MSAAIGGIMASTASDATRKNRFGEMSSEDFMKILVQELTNQDPLAPNDTKQVLEQLSSLRNIESQMDLQKSLESLVGQNQVAQASGMIGKVVEGLDTSDKKINGQVTSVRIVDGRAVLELDTGKSLPMDRVTKIAPKTEPAPTTAGGTGGTGTGTGTNAARVAA